MNQITYLIEYPSKCEFCSRLSSNAQPKKLSERPFFKNLSRKTVSVLRSKLPTSGIVYSSLDGSVCLKDIAKYLHVSPDAIATAALPDEDGKRHLLIFELTANGHQERRIAAWRSFLSCLFTTWKLANFINGCKMHQITGA